MGNYSSKKRSKANFTFKDDMPQDDFPIREDRPAANFTFRSDMPRDRPQRNFSWRQPAQANFTFESDIPLELPEANFSWRHPPPPPPPPPPPRGNFSWKKPAPRGNFSWKHEPEHDSPFSNRARTPPTGSKEDYEFWNRYVTETLKRGQKLPMPPGGFGSDSDVSRNLPNPKGNFSWNMDAPELGFDRSNAKSGTSRIHIDGGNFSLDCSELDGENVTLEVSELDGQNVSIEYIDNTGMIPVEREFGTVRRRLPDFY